MKWQFWITTIVFLSLWWIATAIAAVCFGTTSEQVYRVIGSFAVGWWSYGAAEWLYKEKP